MRSMTGFGRGEAETNGRKVTIEIKTVNHRFLDINIRMPRALGFAEEGLRKSVKENLSRGRVDIFVNYSTESEDAREAKADIGFIKSYLSAARAAGQTCGLEDDIKLTDILRIPDAIIIEEAMEDESMQSKLCSEALKSAMQTLSLMREREGSQLKDNIISCLNDLNNIVRLVDSRKETVPAEYAQKLRQRISELLCGAEVDETRFAAEVAYMADRSDITEEIVRLGTHINQFRKAIEDKEAVGRKLDFIVQEMNRELNTIGSKSLDMEITNAVIEGKSIVEKIREQVQNIE